MDSISFAGGLRIGKRYPRSMDSKICQLAFPVIIRMEFYELFVRSGAASGGGGVATIEADHVSATHSKLDFP